MDIKSKSFDLSGMDEINEALAKLSAYAEADVLKIAAREAMKLVEDEAKSLAPERTGQLKRAIRIRAGKTSKTAFSILVSLGKKWFTGDQFYGAFQEFGWKSGARTGSVKIDHKGNEVDSRHEIPGEHFMQVAMETKQDEALALFIEKVREGIANEAKK